MVKQELGGCQSCVPHRVDGWTGEWMDGRLDGWMINQRIVGWMDGRVDSWLDNWKDDWTVGWMVNEWLGGWMVGWMDGWIGN